MNEKHDDIDLFTRLKTVWQKVISADFKDCDKELTEIYYLEQELKSIWLKKEQSGTYSRLNDIELDNSIRNIWERVVSSEDTISEEEQKEFDNLKKEKKRRKDLYTKKNNLELKQISDLYGDEMYQICRTYFKELLSSPGLLISVLQTHFPTKNPGKNLAKNLLSDNDDLCEFIDFINSYIPKEDFPILREDTGKSPEQLLDEAGYILYECHSEDDIQSFRKYYSKKGEVHGKPNKYGVPNCVGEELCTFNGGRLKTDVVYFAVKKNVDEIKREKFTKPERDDEYGTSVISIQFTRKDPCELSIKNRYNHGAPIGNPDRTFGNNLDRIIPGLTVAFEKRLGRKIEEDDYDRDDYSPSNSIKGPNKLFYKKICQSGEVYYCSDNIIIDHDKVIQYPTDKYIVMGYFIIDKQQKTIKLYDERIKDSFIDTIPPIETISEEVNKETGERRIIINNNIIITLNRENNIIGYDNPSIEKIGSGFLGVFTKIETINLPNVAEIGDSFMYASRSIESLSLPKVKKIGRYFMSLNRSLKSLYMPILETVGDSFLSMATIEQVDLPNLRETGDNFMQHNHICSKVNFPKLEKVGHEFLSETPHIKTIDLPSLKASGDLFLSNSVELISVNLPMLETTGYSFLSQAASLEILSLPRLKVLKKGSLKYNQKLKSLDIPEVITIEEDTLLSCNEKIDINAPNLTSICKGSFIDRNHILYHEFLYLMPQHEEDFKSSAMGM